MHSAAIKAVYLKTEASEFEAVAEAREVFSTWVSIISADPL